MEGQPEALERQAASGYSAPADDSATTCGSPAAILSEITVLLGEFQLLLGHLLNHPKPDPDTSNSVPPRPPDAHRQCTRHTQSG
jgi:hypothetical protein